MSKKSRKICQYQILVGSIEYKKYNAFLFSNFIKNLNKNIFDEKKNNYPIRLCHKFRIIQCPCTLQQKLKKKRL